MGSGNTGTGEDMEKNGLIITDLLIELSNFDFPSSFFFSRRYHKSLLLLFFVVSFSFRLM